MGGRFGGCLGVHAGALEVWYGAWAGVIVVVVRVVLQIGGCVMSYAQVHKRRRSSWQADWPYPSAPAPLLSSLFWTVCLRPGLVHPALRHRYM